MTSFVITTVHLLKSPKAIITLGVVVIAAVVALAAMEKRTQVADRTLAPGVVTLTDAERAAQEAAIAEAQADLADSDVGNDFNAHLEIALAKEKLGDREGAAAVYREMNRRFAGNYLSYSNLGKLYQEDVKCDLAAAQFRQAITNAPRNPHVYRNYVDLATYTCPDAYRDTIPDILTDGLAVIPGSIDLMAMMAVYHRDFGNIEDAIHWYELLLVSDQENKAALEEVKELKEKLRKQETTQ